MIGTSATDFTGKIISFLTAYVRKQRASLETASAGGGGEISNIRAFSFSFFISISLVMRPPESRAATGVHGAIPEFVLFAVPFILIPRKGNQSSVSL